MMLDDEYDLLCFFRDVMEDMKRALAISKYDDDPVEPIAILRLVELEIRTRDWPPVDQPTANTYAERAADLAQRYARKYRLRRKGGLEAAVLSWIGRRGARRFYAHSLTEDGEP